MAIFLNPIAQSKNSLPARTEGAVDTHSSVICTKELQLLLKVDKGH